MNGCETWSLIIIEEHGIIEQGAESMELGTVDKIAQ
jgi:hypothetical protein